jgi:uncharacterized protein (DUF4415 family)
MHIYMHTEFMRKQAAQSPGGHSGRRGRGNRPGTTTAGTASRRQRGAEQGNGEATPRGKTRLTMYLDMAVVEYFRSRAGGRGYQTLINEALRQAITQENLEDVLRRVIREEARPYQTGKGKT